MREGQTLSRREIQDVMTQASQLGIRDGDLLALVRRVTGGESLYTCQSFHLGAIRAEISRQKRAQGRGA